MSIDAPVTTTSQTMDADTIVAEYADLKKITHSQAITALILIAGGRLAALRRDRDKRKAAAPTVEGEGASGEVEPVDPEFKSKKKKAKAVKVPKEKKVKAPKEKKAKAKGAKKASKRRTMTVVSGSEPSDIELAGEGDAVEDSPVGAELPEPLTDDTGCDV